MDISRTVHVSYEKHRGINFIFRRDWKHFYDYRTQRKMKHVTRPGKLTIFNYKIKMHSYLKIKKIINYEMNNGKTLHNPYKTKNGE